MRTDCTCPPNNCDQLVCLAKIGDQQAWQQLHDQFSSKIAVYVRHRLGSDRSAYCDDAQQEILARIFVKLPTWNCDGHFCDWLAVVAYRHAINIGIQLKARRCEVELGEIEIESPRPVDPSVRECFKVTAAGFPLPWQIAMKMRSQNCKNSEVAAELGVSTKTIKNWISAMYDALCDCLPDRK